MKKALKLKSSGGKGLSTKGITWEWGWKMALNSRMDSAFRMSNEWSCRKGRGGGEERRREKGKWEIQMGEKRAKQGEINVWDNRKLAKTFRMDVYIRREMVPCTNMMELNCNLLAENMVYRYLTSKWRITSFHQLDNSIKNHDTIIFLCTNWPNNIWYFLSFTYFSHRL